MNAREAARSSTKLRRRTAAHAADSTPDKILNLVNQEILHRDLGIDVRSPLNDFGELVLAGRLASTTPVKTPLHIAILELTKVQLVEHSLRERSNGTLARTASALDAIAKTSTAETISVGSGDCIVHRLNEFTWFSQ